MERFEENYEVIYNSPYKASHLASVQLLVVGIVGKGEEKWPARAVYKKSKTPPKERFAGPTVLASLFYLIGIG